MKLTYLALPIAAVVGLAVGLAIAPADAQQTRPLQVVGGPLVPVGASVTTAWVLDPNSRTIYACLNPPNLSCTKTQLP